MVVSVVVQGESLEGDDESETGKSTSPSSTTPTFGGSRSGLNIFKLVDGRVGLRKERTSTVKKRPT